MNTVACLDDCEIGLAAATAEQTSQIRCEKVLSVKAQLDEGRYYLTHRLDAVLDRILEDLLQ